MLTEKKEDPVKSTTEATEKELVVEESKNTENTYIKNLLSTSMLSQDRFQDNSVFRVLKNWEEGPTKQT